VTTTSTGLIGQNSSETHCVNVTNEDMDNRYLRGFDHVSHIMTHIRTRATTGSETRLMFIIIIRVGKVSALGVGLGGEENKKCQIAFFFFFGQVLIARGITPYPPMSLQKYGITSLPSMESDMSDSIEDEEDFEEIGSPMESQLNGSVYDETEDSLQPHFGATGAPTMQTAAPAPIV